MRMQAFDGLDADYTLMFDLVRQKRRTGDIADGVNSWHVGLAHTVDNNRAAVGFHAEPFQPKIFDVADDSDRRNHSLDRECLRAALAVVDCRGDTIALLVEFRDFSTGKDLDALLFKALARERSYFRIFRWQDLRQHLDDRHL